jgi:hypothetical protein
MTNDQKIAFGDFGDFQQETSRRGTKKAKMVG